MARAILLSMKKPSRHYLTEEGHDHVEQYLDRDPGVIEGRAEDYMTRLTSQYPASFKCSTTRPFALYQKDVEYTWFKDNEVVIVDEFTGRTMPGRRWSEGLHQAIEAKEGGAYSE